MIYDPDAMIPLARSSLESMTPLGELISVTAIERELSMTHRVCGETLFRLRKKPNHINNIPIIINDHRRSRLRGDMKKLIGEEGIYESIYENAGSAKNCFY